MCSSDLYFSLHREEFLAHYHRRSMIETTFSMVKRKYGDGVRAKSDTAMKNEVLAKFVCHNICCVVAAIYERGIDPTFLGLDGKPDDRPRDQGYSEIEGGALSMARARWG